MQNWVTTIEYSVNASFNCGRIAKLNQKRSKAFEMFLFCRGEKKECFINTTRYSEHTQKVRRMKKNLLLYFGKIFNKQLAFIREEKIQSMMQGRLWLNDPKTSAFCPHRIVGCLSNFIAKVCITLEEFSVFASQS